MSVLQKLQSSSKPQLLFPIHFVEVCRQFASLSKRHFWNVFQLWGLSEQIISMSTSVPKAMESFILADLAEIQFLLKGGWIWIIPFISGYAIHFTLHLWKSLYRLQIAEKWTPFLQFFPNCFWTPFPAPTYRSEATCSSLPPIAWKTIMVKFKNPQSWLSSSECTTRTTLEMPGKAPSHLIISARDNNMNSPEGSM